MKWPWEKDDEYEHKTIRSSNMETLVARWVMYEDRGWHVEQEIRLSNLRFDFYCKLKRKKVREICGECMRDAEYNGLCWKHDYERAMREIEESLGTTASESSNTGPKSA